MVEALLFFREIYKAYYEKQKQFASAYALDNIEKLGSTPRGAFVSFLFFSIREIYKRYYEKQNSLTVKRSTESREPSSNLGLFLFDLPNTT